MKIGRIDNLMHMNVDRTGNRGKSLAQVACDLVVCRIVTLDLDIDRRGKAKVQDLRNDVGRLEEEGQIRELTLQLQPQLFDVPLGWAMMLFVKRDQDLAVGAADGGAIAEGVVEGLRTETDVVDDELKLICRNGLADLIFHL